MAGDGLSKRVDPAARPYPAQTSLFLMGDDFERQAGLQKAELCDFINA
jgi:hypothetical protein